MSQKPKNSPSPGSPEETFPPLLGISVTSLPDAELAGHLAGELRKQAGRAVQPLLLIQGREEETAQIAGMAREAGFPEDSIATLPMHGGTAADLMTLIHACDDFILVRPVSCPTDDEALRHYALESGCASFSLLQPGEDKALLAPGETTPKAGWLPDLFRQLHLPPRAGLQEVFERADALANQTAPSTRSWWQRILTAQAIALILPFSWFLASPFGFSTAIAAVLGAAGILTLIGITWWLRWRGMQTAWARSRLVAEVCRSLLSSAEFSLPASLAGLETIPALRPLLWHARRLRTEEKPGWRDAYITRRLDDQSAHFAHKQQEAAQKRELITRWATLLMDITLALAAVGLVLSLSQYSEIWLRSLGDRKFLAVFGLLVGIPPLAALMLQSLQSVLSLGRRTARYEQQQAMLRDARQRMLATGDEGCHLSIAHHVEQNLRAEVVEWYFQAETSEHFFTRFLRRRAPGSGPALKDRKEPLASRIPWLARTSTLLLFTLRVVLGRLVLPLVAVALVLAVLSFRRIQLEEGLMAHAEIKNAQLERFVPNPERSRNGLIVIAHGLHGDVSSENHWTTAMAAALKERLGPNAPEIAIIDWKQEASDLGFSPIITDDIAAIRPQARRVGNFVAVRLQEWLDEGKITIDQPIHLIGHSAGGFLVSRVALKLKDRDKRNQIHVTLLDTPGIDGEITSRLASAFPGRVEFYQSSVFSANDLATNKAFFFSSVDNEFFYLNPVAAHSYVNDWFISTIRQPEADRGFIRSPFFRQPATPTQTSDAAPATR